jgi:hypothetical protein
MAVYSYTSSANLNITNGYPQDLLDIYPGYSASNYNEEKITFDYNESSIYGPDSIDYGFINEVESFYDNYGDITEDIILSSQRENYGFITDNISIKPFGKLSTLGSFASDSLIRTSVGGVVFLLFGKCLVAFPSKYEGNSEIDIEGTSLIRFRLRYTSSGSILARSATLEEPASVSFHYRGSGTIGEVSGTAESFRYSYTEAQGLFKFLGSAITFPVFYETTRAFDIVGNVDESITYDYNESSRIDFNSDDYGFINEVVLRSEDYGLITEGEDIQRWDTRTEDHGLITEDITSTPYGLFRFDSTTTDSTLIPYTGSGTVKVQGEGFGRPTPRQLGGGSITLSGTPTVRIRLRYPGSGSLFGFSSTSEATVVQTEQQGTLKIIGHAEENFSKGNYTASGSVFSFVSAAETISSTQSISQSLFSIVGDAEIRIRMRYFASGSLFGFSGAAERVTYSYNESSIVNVDQSDYGFVSEAETFQEDYEYIYGDPYYPWQNDDYGFLTPDQPNFPYGEFRVISTTADSQTKIYIGSGTARLNGNAKVFVLPKHTGTGIACLQGVAHESNTENYVGSGSIFTFASTTQSTAVVEESKELFRFTGTLTEKFGKGNYDGSGSLFGFSSTTESSSNTQVSTGLFKFSGNVIEKNTENYVGSGSLFSIVGHIEKATYSYNESSVVEFTSDDYGFISEPPYEDLTCNPISYYGDELISDYASEIVSEFGCILNDYNYDYGLVGEQVTWQYEDHGFLTPEYTNKPYGLFRLISSTKPSASLLHVGSANLTISDSAVPLFRLKVIGSGLPITLSGAVSDLKATFSNVGSGSIFTFVSKTETATVSEFSTELFKFSGSAIEKNSENYVGSTNISVFGEARIFVLPKHNGSGFIRLGGNAAESTTPTTHIGSGSIFSFVSATKSVSVTPPVPTELFKFSGGVTNLKATFNNVGSGTFRLGLCSPGLTGDGSRGITIFKLRVTETGRQPIVISGKAAESTTPATHIGKGSIFTFISGTKSTSVTPPVPSALFKFSGGVTNLRATFNNVGSGSLFTFKSTTESRSLSEFSTVLFKFSGKATESRTPATHIGKGSIFAFASGTKSFAVNPPVPSALFKFAGHAIERDAKSYAGSGSIFTFVSKTETRRVSEFSTELFKFSGNVVEKRRKSYNGKGSLFGFTSTTQSTTYRPSVPSVLFKISGRGAVSKTPATYVGSGSIFTFISKTETRRVSEFSTELFKFSGSAIERNIDNYKGSGTITAFNNAVSTFRLRVISNGSLIKFGGKGKEAFGQAPYSGFVEINIDGISSNRTVEYVSPKPPRIYVI